MKKNALFFKRCISLGSRKKCYFFFLKKRLSEQWKQIKIVPDRERGDDTDFRNESLSRKVSRVETGFGSRLSCFRHRGQ